MHQRSTNKPKFLQQSRALPVVALTLLLGACGGGGKTAQNTVPVPKPSDSVTISGTVSYEFVPPNPVCRGLDFAGTIPRPIRGATVQLIDVGTGAVLAASQSDESGDYTFAGIDANTIVRLRIRAELKKTTGDSRWHVEVRDNYDISASPPALGSRPLYVVEGANFDTGSVGVAVQNMTATTGWGGASYVGDRAAAPFSILDTIYTAMTFIESVDPNVIFPPLDAFWSVNNTSATSSDTDTGADTGELGGSFYSVGQDRLFLVGDAASDTEEFDDHVIVHEWGHYFEDNLSRADSFGGPHSIGNLLDPRLAFGEGWATALAGMALNDPLYCDTGPAGSTSGFGIGAESGSYDASGWYDEISVLRFIYDMFDSNDEGGDSGSIGFAPIYAVMTGPQISTDAFTTIFSFAAELRPTLDLAGQALLDAQLAREDMTAGFDIWGVGEANTAGGAPDVIPIYTDLTADGSILPICVNSQFDSGRDGNKLTENRFLRITIPLTDQYDVTMTTTTPTPVTPDVDDRDQSDPDIYLFRGPQFIGQGTSPDDNTETFRTPILEAGATYIAAVEDWRFDDEMAPSSYPERICFEVSFASTP
ncbi:MAG: carboxypeptidase-like regulatory domain-containing protein [Woeseiaceae bacterium]|nr:carboxypeptidase-like regulatory domain-containing protein [Woeseiaceae bacterium]MDX2609272.1 carboxypeptidase-like regulatory domain-containing protein [Woeseiaceae bacterium]